MYDICDPGSDATRTKLFGMSIYAKNNVTDQTYRFRTDTVANYIVFRRAFINNAKYSSSFYVSSMYGMDCVRFLADLNSEQWYEISNTNLVSSTWCERHFLEVHNTAEYTPTSDYHPATKKYVDDSLFYNNSYREIASIIIPEDPTTDTTATWITDSDNNIIGFTIDKDSDGNIFYLQKVYALFSGVSANDGTSTKDLILKLNGNTQDNFSLKGLVKNDRAEATLTIECLPGTDQVMITGAVMINAPWGGQATPYMMTPNSDMYGRNNLAASSITKLTFTSDVAIKPGGKIKIFGTKYIKDPDEPQ